ncbi:DedA family protein [Corynebacterium nuruki]|nr:DedA family protein [Corynebacterium nuruki]
MITTVVDWIVSLMAVIGAPGVGLAILIETVFPPIPSEVVLPLAGFASTEGRMSALAAFLWATAGSVVGAWLLYWLGAAVGADRLRAVADRMWLTEGADVDRALHWFDRYGEATVLIARVIPGIRSLVSIPAGVHRMGPVKFTLLTTLGSAVWNAVLIGLGVLLGDNYHRVSDTIDNFSTLIYVLVALACVAGVIWLVRRDRRRKAARREA